MALRKTDLKNDLGLLKYRPEVDGLRTVAVIPVILFHAGFTMFSGGYVGVDVFFVISGYLITTILIEARATGTYSLWTFYERRARRILPALFLVLGVCLPVAWVSMPPYLFEDFARSLAFAVLFVSNVHFWENAGYFALEAELQPLLHTWSLAVEEQYYLLFPLLLLALGRFRRWRFSLVFALLAVLSLALSEWGWRNHPDENFFFTFSRFWELLAGSLCAVWLYRAPMRSNDALAGLGLGLIVYSILAFDALVPFPSLYTLVPVIGTMLIILCAGPKTITARLLSLPVMVGIGLISYSAYLWHQPLFAFARILSPDHPSPVLMGGLALASLGLAWLSWRFVERPFRDPGHRLFPPRRGIYAASVTGIAIFAAIGFTGSQNGGFPQRMDRHLTSEWRGVIASFSEPVDFNRCANGADRFLRFSKLCVVYQVPSPERRFGVLGDSHATALLSGFSRVSQEHNATIISGSVPACPPLLGVSITRSAIEQKHCRQAVEAQIAGLQEAGVDLVFLVARWSLYATDDYDGPVLNNVLAADGLSFARTPDAALAALDQGLETTIARLTGADIRVVLVAQVPAQRVHARQMFERAVMAGRDRAATLERIKESFVSAADHQRMQSRAYSALRAHESEMASVVTLDPAFAVEDRLAWFKDGASLYADRDHLTVRGAHLAGSYLASVLHDILPR